MKLCNLQKNIFTYLNYCPTKDFYVLSSVIKSESAKNILLALTSMMKTSQNAGQKSYIKIFTKAMEIFKLSRFEEIDTITRENGIDVLRNDFKAIFYFIPASVISQRSFPHRSKSTIFL